MDWGCDAMLITSAAMKRAGHMCVWCQPRWCELLPAQQTGASICFHTAKIVCCTNAIVTPMPTCHMRAVQVARANLAVNGAHDTVLTSHQ